MDEMNSTATTLLDDHREAFKLYYDMLVSWNEKMNLTAITDRREVYFKHFADSVLVCATPEWREAAVRGHRIVDIGTGAGFPGLPLAICHPEVHFVLCDALQKRVNFLTEVVSALGLTNVEPVHGRAEELARERSFRNQFHAVVSRALARMNVLAELTMPFARAGGWVMAFKGPGVVDELHDGKRAAGQLGGELVRLVEMDLPEGQGHRTIVVFKQLSQTPKTFPRKAGTPQKKPL